MRDLETDVRDAIAAIDQPIDSARGIPASWYWDPTIFGLEQERLFKRTWMAVCFSHEIAGSGDVFPARVAGTEVVVLRSPDGSVKAFHNVCRHRAARVVTQKAKKKRTLQCSYHCWTYGLDGKLRNAPYFDGQPSCKFGDSDETNLVPIRCDEWLGMVFINLDGNAKSLGEHVKPLNDRWQQYELESLSHFATEERSIPANWKVVMEGLLEVYHEHFIHKDLTYRLSESGAKTWEDILTDEMMGFRSVMPVDAPGNPATTIPRLAGMPTEGEAPTEIFLMFPSVSVNVMEDHFVRTIWTYDGPKTTTWKSDWLFVPGAERTEEQARECREIVEFWKTVRAEDLDAVLSVQAGLESNADFPIETRYSPFWEPILQHFHLRVARGLEAK